MSETPFIIESQSQLKVIADPLRQRILGAFAGGPSTVKVVASELGLSPTRLYRHVDMLVEAGFLKSVAEVQRRGTIERTFAATARRIAIGSGAFPGTDGVSEREAMVRDTLERLLARPRDPGSLLVIQARVRLSQEGLRSLQTKIAALVEELDDPTAPPGDVMMVLAAGKSEPLKTRED